MKTMTSIYVCAIQELQTLNKKQTAIDTEDVAEYGTGYKHLQYLGYLKDLFKQEAHALPKGILDDETTNLDGDTWELLLEHSIFSFNIKRN